MAYNNHDIINELTDRHERNIKLGWLGCDKFNFLIYDEFLKNKNKSSINFNDLKNKLLVKMKKPESELDNNGNMYILGYNIESIEEIEKMSVFEIEYIYNDIRIKYFELIENFNKQIESLNINVL